MNAKPAIAVVGTFDSKADEHLFLKDCIEQRDLPTMTINIGTKNPCPVAVHLDLFEVIVSDQAPVTENRDTAINAMLLEAKAAYKADRSSKKPF